MLITSAPTDASGSGQLVVSQLPSSTQTRLQSYPQPGDVIAAVSYALHILHNPSFEAAEIPSLEAFLANPLPYPEQPVLSQSPYFLKVLEAALDSPQTPLDRLPRLSPSERNDCLRQSRSSDTTRFTSDTVCSIFAQNASRFAGRPALTHQEHTLTYAELDAHSNRLATFLLESRPEIGPFVAIALPSGVERIVAMLAILKLDRAYLSLDLNYPKDRLDFMLEDAGRPLVIDSETYLQAFAGPLHPSAAPAPTSKSRSAAYLMYTSGSTGQPKGVIVPHGGIVRLVCQPNYFSPTEQDVFAQWANPCFDAITWEVWGALLNGAHLVVLPQETLLSPRAFAAAVSRHQISAMLLTTAIFNAMVSQVPEAVASVRYVVSGGEAADPTAVHSFLRVHGKGSYINAYGPTEATVIGLTHQVDRLDEAAPCIPIGRPISHTGAYVLDRHMSPVPDGFPGQLFLSGPGVALGYWNRPDLTKERFLPDPFSDEPDATMYATGDLVRRDPDGLYYFLGRIDTQVKIRGFRIEPGEIESALRACPGVREAAVVAVSQGGNAKILAAFVETATNVPLNSILEFLRERLPDHMIPSRLTLVPRIPLTPNGKIDRRALSAPPDLDAASPQQPLAPGLESQIAKIWNGLLGLTSVGRDDNFFELGGTSILLPAMESQLNEILTQPVAIMDLFRFPTIRTLAEHLSAPLPAGAKPSSGLGERALRQGAAFAAFRSTRGGRS